MEEIRLSEENEYQLVAIPADGKTYYDTTFTVDPKMSTTIEDNWWKQRKRLIHLKGFRKGKAPRAVVEKRSIGGRDGFYAETFQQYANIKTAEITPNKIILTDDLHACKNDKGEWNVTSKIWMDPEVELLDDFESIKLKTQKLEVGDYVERKIAAFAKINPWLHTKTTDEGEPIPSEEGDMVEVSIDAFADDKPYADGSEESTNIRLIPESVKPQSLYDKLIGVNPGDEFTINVDSVDSLMPHYQRELEGKKFRMEVKIKFVYTCEEPKIDDDLAITAGYDNMDGWKKALNDSAEMIIKGEDKRTKRALLMGYAVNRTKIDDYPDQWAAFKAAELLQRKKVVGTIEDLTNQIKNIAKQNRVLIAVGEKLEVEWEDSEKSRYQRNEEAYADKVLELLLNKTEFTYVDLESDIKDVA